MRDSEVVVAIVAGDADGLAEAYDRYAAPLYTYCRSLLREPADAADAVQDTFVIAASKLAGLRDQSRLRPWLYAVARNECHRRLRETASGAGPALDLVPEMSDESADVTGGAERAELRTLLRSAIRGLNASEQDLIELQLRQELDVVEIAAILGVTRNHAHALLTTISLRASAAAGPLAAQAAPAGAALPAAGICVSCTLTVNPGDLTVTVLIEVSARPTSPAPSCPPPSSASEPGSRGPGGRGNCR
jgi:RNA polymerase sigma factor (sigma-70 family)